MSRSFSLDLNCAVGIIWDAPREAVLVASRAAHKPFADCWEFPGGKIEPGELSVATLKRELKEELGIVVQAAEFRFVTQHHYAELGWRVQLHIFDVQSYQGQVRGCEGQTLRFVPLSELDRIKFPEGNSAIVNFLLQQTIS